MPCSLDAEYYFYIFNLILPQVSFTILHRTTIFQIILNFLSNKISLYLVSTIKKLRTYFCLAFYYSNLYLFRLVILIWRYAQVYFNLSYVVGKKIERFLPILDFFRVFEYYELGSFSKPSCCSSSGVHYVRLSFAPFLHLKI